MLWKKTFSGYHIKIEILLTICVIKKIFLGGYNIKSETLLSIVLLKKKEIHQNIISKMKYLWVFCVIKKTFCGYKINKILLSILYYQEKKSSRYNIKRETLLSLPWY